MSKNRKKTRHIRKSVRITLIVIALLISSLAVWYYIAGGKGWIAYTWHGNHEPFTALKETSTEPLYSDETIEKVLEKYDYLNDHYDVSQVVQNSYVIPGLKATLTLEDYQDNTAGPSMCTSMTPQGIALTDRYLLISAYCHTGKHHSVIYMVDRDSHELVKTITLFDKSHVGSVTYDDVNQLIWVCCYDEETAYAYVRAFTLQAAENYDEDAGIPITFTKNYPIKTQKRASFMTFFNNALYIGYFSKDIDSEFTVQRFTLTETGDLLVSPNVDKQKDSEPDSIAMPVMKEIINGGMQGYARNTHETAILRSFGSDNDSKLLLFESVSDDIGTLNLTDSNADAVYLLPPMGEEVCMDQDDLYICFESGAYAYRARETEHVDRILVLKTSALKKESE